MVTYHDIVFAMHHVAQQLHVPIVPRSPISLSVIFSRFLERHSHSTAIDDPRAPTVKVASSPLQHIIRYRNIAIITQDHPPPKTAGT
jgi:hypothetical protein